ncbi:MAG: TIR domain-containing protein, partial [Xanthomonadales bacterium]|nr:TIR domain-containing protein [Xanthomonadales bacterium]
MSTYKYRAFLCYSHADKAWADWLHHEIERYRVPKRLVAEHPNSMPRNLRPVFRDREELPSASSLPKLIEEALEQSETLIVVCSPAAAASRWVDNEIRTFQALGREENILCLIVDGEPNSGDARECFPAALLGAGGQEPIAADVRPGGDGKSLAKQKIIAGLLGVGLDELVQRELHRRHSRQIKITAAATAIALVMTGLAVTAIISQQEAERRREDAETLVGFMIGDLRESLHEVGRMDLFDSVADQASRYFTSLGGEDARDEVLAMRAETLRQIGQVRMDQGGVKDAEQSFIEAREISAQLVARDPSRADWQVSLANDHFYLGYLAWQRGDLDAASAAFQSQLALVDEIAATEPTNPEWLSEKLYAWTNYGRVLEARGELENAQAAYQQVMESAERLKSLEPENIEWDLELGFAHNNIGKLSIALGQLSEAAEHYAIDLEIKRRAHESQSSNNLWREYLGVSLYFQGEVLRLLGRSEAALDALREAREIFRNLIVYEEEATLPWHWRLGMIERSIGVLHLQNGRIDAANGALTSALETFSELTATDPGNAVWQRDQAHTHLE